jgi:hypothetical protein
VLRVLLLLYDECVVECFGKFRVLGVGSFAAPGLIFSKFVERILRIRNQLSKFELGVVKESEEEFRIVLKNSE